MRKVLCALVLLACGSAAQAQTSASADLGMFRFDHAVTDTGNMSVPAGFTVLSQEAGRTDIRLDSMITAVQSEAIHWPSGGTIDAGLSLNPIGPYVIESVVLHGWYDGELRVGAIPPGSRGDLGYAHNHAQIDVRDYRNSGTAWDDRSFQQDDIGHSWPFDLAIGNRDGGGMSLDVHALAHTDAASTYYDSDNGTAQSYAQLGLGEAVLTVFTRYQPIPEPPLWLMLAGGLPLALGLRRGKDHMHEQAARAHGRG